MKPIPPMPGTQSGICMLFRLFKNVLIPLIIALIGALKIAAIPETIPEKMLTIPSQAALQLPEKTFVIKSIKP